MADFSLMQMQIRRDPDAYREDFFLQRDHFQNLLRVYLLSPSENTQYFCQLIAFLSNVAHHYRHELTGYEQKVLSLLEERNASLDPKLRLTLIKAVIQLRVHDVLLPQATLPLFFRLLGTQDKTVREVVQKHIMADLRGINTGRRNEKTNKLLQNFLFTLLRESDEMTSACATEVVVHLYNQHIWTGAKTVNVLATAALSPIAKVASRALRFFLSDDKAANETDEERAKKVEELNERYDDTSRLNNNYSKKSRNRVAKLEARMHYIARKRERLISDDTVLNVNFPAIQLLDDAQGFAERMLQNLRKVRETLDIRVLRMNMISRVIALHEVFLDGFYSHLIKYIQPHQQQCTYVLACLAQACHALVDPDTLRPALMAVVDRFVSDRSRPEVMAVGLNAVREICARTPLVMDATLLSDLLMYVKHRDKPVATAARSLLNLYRVLDPSLLHKSQRGREAAMAGAAPLRYGESTTADGVENINLLARYREHGEQFPYVAGDGNDVDDEDQSVDASELSHDEGAGDDDDGISFEDENEDDVEVEGDEGEEQEEEEEEEEDDDDEEQQEEQEDDDDDDDEDEVDVDDEDDDAVDNVDDNADDVMTSKKRTSSAARLDAVRILSDSDFADLERAVEVARDAGSNAVKRKRMVEVEDEIGPLNAPIDKSVLEKGLKVAMTKEERQAKFGPEAKRADRRAKFGMGSRVKSGGKTNMEKEHSKARLLTRYGTRARLRHNKKDPPKKRFGEFKNGRKVRPNH